MKLDARSPKLEGRRAEGEGRGTLDIAEMSVTWKKYKINRKQIAKIKVNSNQRHQQQKPEGRQQQAEQPSSSTTGSSRQQAEVKRRGKRGWIRYRYRYRY